MAGLPTDVSICTVVGRLASTEQVANSDAEPDVTPLTGKVIFRASVPHVIHKNSNTIFVPQKIEAVLDSQGNFSAQIVASNDPDLNPYNWTYNVSFQLANAVIAPFNFIALGGVTMEITDIIPIAASTGIPVTAGGEGPQGPPGPPGEDGEPGDSAYEIAVQQGFTGDINAWLDSLEGAPGSSDPQAIRDIVIDMMESGTGIDVTSYDPISLTVRSYYGYRGQWSNSAYYWVGDMVYHNQKFYQAQTTGVINQNPTTNPDDWTELPVNAASGGVTDHGLLTGLSDDDHTQYLNQTRGDARYYIKANTYTQAEVNALVSGAVAGTDHGGLVGLGDDDHTQYLNNARGDVRYYTKAQVDSAIATALAAAGSQQTVDAKTASYTLVAGDIGKILTFNSTSAMNLNIPTDASVTWPVGSRVDAMVLNTGMVTAVAVTPGTTTVNATPSAVTRARYSAFSAVKVASNSWVIVGDLA